MKGAKVSFIFSCKNIWLIEKKCVPLHRCESTAHADEIGGEPCYSGLSPFLSRSRHFLFLEAQQTTQSNKTLLWRNLSKITCKTPYFQLLQSKSKVKAKQKASNLMICNKLNTFVSGDDSARTAVWRRF